MKDFLHATLHLVPRDQQPASEKSSYTKQRLPFVLLKPSSSSSNATTAGILPSQALKVRLGSLSPELQEDYLAICGSQTFLLVRAARLSSLRLWSDCSASEICASKFGAILTTTEHAVDQKYSLKKPETASYRLTSSFSGKPMYDASEQHSTVADMPLTL